MHGSRRYFDPRAQGALLTRRNLRRSRLSRNRWAKSTLREVLDLVEMVAPADSTVLLLGRTGTGKELIARAIHDRSRRENRTLVKINCAAIPHGPT